MLKPRRWQQVALAKFMEHKKLNFLEEVTPGGGKTIFAGFCAAELLAHGHIDFALNVVPTTAIKGDREAGFTGDWSKIGVEITPVLMDGKNKPEEYQGAVITYSQLPNIVSTFETWARNGIRLFACLDEVHHLTEDNIWGAAAERLSRCCVKLLTMTGTPFRGDQKRISFLNYGADGKTIADHRYRYREAVAEKICREITFVTDDGVAEYLRDDLEKEIRISEAEDTDEADVSRTIFAPGSAWLERFISRADQELDEYRAWDSDAGGLVVCRPGGNQWDEKHLVQIAKTVARVTGEEPDIVYHEDKDANAKIERFRKGKSKWICAVRKITEGVDIKRLRVLAMACCPTTELLARQIWGRVCRVDDESRPGTATAFIAKLPSLTEWASRVAAEAQAGIEDAENAEREQREHSEKKDPTSTFVPIMTLHERGGAISDFGDAYTEAEITEAENYKVNDPQLLELSVTKIAYLLRKAGVVPSGAESFTKPLYFQKKERRREIDNAVKRYAYKLNPIEPNFRQVWIRIHKISGAKDINDLMDNHSLDVMDQVLNVLGHWMAE